MTTRTAPAPPPPASLQVASSSSSLTRVGRNTSILFGSQIATWVIGVMVIATVPRLLGPVAVGELAVAVSLWAIAGVFITFGSGTLITLDSALDPSSAGRLVGPVLRLQLTMTGLALAVLTGFAVLVGYSSTTVALVVVVGIVTLAGSVWSIGNAALVGMEQMSTLARAAIISRIAGAAATVVVVVATRNVIAVAMASITWTLVAIPMLVRPLAAAGPISYRSTWTQSTAIARRGLPYLTAALVLIVYQQVDTIVMSLLVDSEQIGWYGAADSLFATLLFAPTILAMAVLPTLTREHGRDPTQALDTLGRGFDVLIVLAVPVGLLTVVSAVPFTHLLYGDRYSGSGPVLAVFGVVLLFTFFSVLFGSYAIATGRQMLWNLVMIVAIVASIALDLLLVPWTNDRFDNGAIGGAIAFVVTEAGMVAAAVWLLVPGLITVHRAARVAKCAAGGAALVGAAMALRQLPFVIPALAGAVAYVVVVVVLRVLGPHEMAALRQMASRRPPTPEPPTNAPLQP